MAQLAEILAHRMALINQLVLEVADDVSPEELLWQAGSAAPSIAFHLWHVARWSDRNQALLPGMAPDLRQRLGAGREIWTSEGLAQAWGLSTATLGQNETGLGMADSDAHGFASPSKEALVDYLRRTVGALDNAFAAVDDRIAEALCSEPSGRPGTIGTTMLSHLTHVCRHLGMIEALRGVHGEQGSATA